MSITHTRTTGKLKNQSGFTLIELMVTVVIIGIISAIAIPSYTQYVVRAKRAAAESFIMSVANRQEQYVLDARQYAGVAADPGDSTGLATLGIAAPDDVAANYSIKIGAVTPTTYKISAVPTGAQATKDAKCGTVSIDQAGTKGVSGSSSVKDCW